ncbi:MAG: hypothetical protein EOO16_06780 [Chitinophagaceae bacterium]|nr:MAG: hypothetical protein EOO16_06780 [Chitinophagaceae bacterium]
MKRSFILLAALAAGTVVRAQAGPVELMAGHRSLHYQHSFSKSFGATGYGWQHIATLIKVYRGGDKSAAWSDELMNQVYITRRLNRWLEIKGGLFYTNAAGYTPTIGLQLAKRLGPWTLAAAPRINIDKTPAAELFALAEYAPASDGGLRPYLRLQLMSNRGTRQHNRSYQQVRIGAQLAAVQAGLGITFDEFGPASAVYVNTGLFVRRVF